MINVPVRTNDNRTRTAAEVKRMLQDLAFILRTTQRVKTEIVAKKKPPLKTANSAISATVIPTCAA